MTGTEAETFAPKGDAGRYLARAQADLERGAWVDPRAGRVTLADYATRWLEHRPNLRTWRAGLLDAGHPGPVTVAKCYRLLRAVTNTAVADEVVVKNPCVVKGAGVERPVATVAERVGAVGATPAPARVCRRSGPPQLERAAKERDGG